MKKWVLAFGLSDMRGKPIRAILADVAEARGVSLLSLVGERRTRKVVLARQEAYWRCQRETNKTNSVIGRAMGRDVSTVLYGARKHAKRMAQDQTP